MGNGGRPELVSATETLDGVESGRGGRGWKGPNNSWAVGELDNLDTFVCRKKKNLICLFINESQNPIIKYISNNK